MTIWQYSENLLANDPTSRVETFYLRVRDTSKCSFCRQPLEAVRDEFNAVQEYSMLDDVGGSPHGFGVGSLHPIATRNEPPFEVPAPRLPGFRIADRAVPPSVQLVERRVRACRVCGWWVAFEESLEKNVQHVIVRSYGGVGALKNLDLRDITMPIEEVRAFLTGRYEKRFVMDPVLFEETVASVFRDLGYHASTTARSGDGGIDVILGASDGTEIGVQVKRYKGTIQVDQIRELTGALVLKGLTRGIFVTTSRFASGASQVADLSAFRGYPIELIDGDRFLDQLELVQRKSTKWGEQHAPWQKSMIQIHQRSREW
jgi:hypothetical protein